MADALMQQRILKFVKTDANGCWLWGGYITPNGYGQIQVNRAGHGAHRVAYVAWKGAVPAGLAIDHLCRVRHCVNPDHLEAVTTKENIRRGETGLRHRSKTHCPQNHPYDDANTYWYRGGRMCRTCRTEAERRKRARRRAAAAAAAALPRSA